MLRFSGSAFLDFQMHGPASGHQRTHASWPLAGCLRSVLRIIHLKVTLWGNYALSNPPWLTRSIQVFANWPGSISRFAQLMLLCVTAHEVDRFVANTLGISSVRLENSADSQGKRCRRHQLGSAKYVLPKRRTANDLLWNNYSISGPHAKVHIVIGHPIVAPWHD